MQFTASLAALLGKIKEGQERQSALFFSEIAVIQKLINNSEAQDGNSQPFSEVLLHTRKMQQSLKVFCGLFSENEIDNNFSWFGVLLFTVKNAPQYYHAVPPDFHEKLAPGTTTGFQQNVHGGIESQLLAMLSQNRFEIVFVCGLKYAQQVFEVYSIKATGQNFIFNVSAKQFYLINAKIVHNLAKNGAHAVKDIRIKKLEERITALEEKAAAVNKGFSKEVTEILEEYFAKISNLNFMEALQKTDVQANILRAMLNLDTAS